MDRANNFVFSSLHNLSSRGLDSDEDIVSNVQGSLRSLGNRVLSSLECGENTAIRFDKKDSILTECFLQYMASCLGNLYVKTSQMTSDIDPKKNPPSAWLIDEAVTGNVDTSVREAADELWIIISNMGSDACGQLLGQAIVKGYDEIRSWISCFIVWSHISLHDPQLPSTAVTVESGYNQLRSYIKQLSQKYDIGDNNSCSSPQARSLGTQSAQFSEFLTAINFLADGIEIIISLNVKHTDMLSDKAGSRKTDGISNQLSDIRYSRSVAHPTCGTYTLVPLHCGHNGMPSSVEVSMISSLIQQKVIRSKFSYGSY